MRQLTVLLVLGLLSLSATGAIRVGGTVAVPTRSPQVLYDDSEGGRIWARADTYKASFDGDGASFTPFLGSRAPRNFPVVFGAATIRAGELEIALDTSVAPTRIGDEVRFDRGIVDESYPVSPSGIEQRFVIESPLEGELVVRIPVETELAARIDGDSLSFANELGGVSYGRATAIDALGRRLELEREFDGDAIEIRVPSAFANSATYPLTIDPVISAFGIFTNTPQVESSPDVTYDGLTQHFFAVTEVAFSATDHDVLSLVFERDGTPIAGSALAVDISSESWATPRCACLATTGEFGVVAAVGVPGPIARSIKSRVRLASGFTATLAISDADDGDNSAPDIAGGATGVNERFCAVWQSTAGSGDVNVNARMIRDDGATSGGVVRVSDSLTFKDSRPALASGSFIGEFEILFEREISTTDHDIYFASVQNAGVVVTPPTALVTGPEDDRQPSISDVEALGVRAMIAFERVVGTSRDVFVANHSFGLTLENLTNFSALDPTTVDREQFAPAIECDGNRFVLAWCERDVSGTNVLAAEYHSSATTPALGLSRVPVTSGAIDAGEVRLCGRMFGVGPNLGVMCVWSDDASGSARDVFGARYEPAVGIPARAVCSGDGSGSHCPCGNVGGPGRGCPNSANSAGALLASTGDAVMTADTFTLLGSGMPPNSSCLYFQGTLQTQTATPFGDGLRCASGTVVRLGVRFNGAPGASNYPSAGDPTVSVRGQIPAQGGTRCYQCWYRNAAAFCTSSTFNFTNALSVVYASL